MRIDFYKSLWGMEGTPIEEAFAKIEAAGYDGVESVLDVLERAPRAARLPMVGMSIVDSVDAFRRDLDRAEALGVRALNVHAGKDWFDFQQGSEFLEETLEAAKGAPFDVVFETHRGRILYDPATTAAYLRRLPRLMLNADFSHWTCVCESLLDDQAESLDLAIARTRMIHARVGHEEGPQVPDPRAPQWSRYVEVFEGWWRRISDACRARGEEVLRIDPEFGPPNYLWTDPQGARPLADLWEVCLWTRDRLRERLG